MTLTDLQTPALLIDLDVMERNLCRVADYAKQHGLRLRPHTKTHKIPSLAKRQIELGASGITVAKVGEAEVMLGADPPDLLVAYPVLGEQKLDRLMQVARRTRVTVALDSAVAARQLSDAAKRAQLEVGVLAEVDVGLGRMGVEPGDELLELIRAIQALPSVSLEGITFYPGHIKRLDDAGRKQLAELDALLKSITSDLRRAGISARIVSGGSTPTLFASHTIRGLNEIRPGTYIFNDRNTADAGACSLEDCAASILVTVVSTARKDRIMVDGGSKTFSSDRPSGSADVTFGYVTDDPEVRFFQMNEEHGYLDVSRAKRRFSVGDRLRIIPNHICVAMNLHEKVYGIRGNVVETVWNVEARGKLQ
ncbi:MAG: alanine racemase [Bryobacteraceae bacterium]|nr:alanine racemase [Bryobacteraceae bacterium]